MQKILAMTVLFGVLSVSAATAQAAGRAGDCCSAPHLESYFYDEDFDYYNQYVHQFVRITWTECMNCGNQGEPTEEVMYEEHDYDIYDLENHTRYCRCGDSIRF